MNVAKFEGFIEEIADRVAERVAAKLGHVAVAVYTTNKRGPHCPGKTRSWMLRHVRSMPGAKKVGRDWIISAEDYQRWVTACDAARIRDAGRPLPAVPTSGPEAMADAFLSEQGYRPNRGRVG